MDITNLLQLGGLGAIAVYLVIFLVKDQKIANKKIIDTLELMCEALGIKKR
jgi:NhaP-type Na+/H+ and K+/H+ antiporter